MARRADCVSSPADRCRRGPPAARRRPGGQRRVRHGQRADLHGGALVRPAEHRQSGEGRPGRGLRDRARRRVGAGVDLGILEALFSLGALAGALAYSAAGARCRRWPLFVLVYLVVGAPRFAVAAGTRTVLPLAVMMTVEGLACGVINPLVATVVFGIVPEQLRARVLAATTAVSLSVAPLGALAAGWLAGSAGLRTALLAVGGLYLAATLCPLIFPVWRQLDQPDTDPGATGDSAGSGAAGNRAAGDRAARALSRRRQPPELPGAR
ncbi:MAG TPA: MFS transporter [Streptosporangiaceae bacterium]|nr:MFS transporter [Streptosporangiaceae bacterium]